MRAQKAAVTVTPPFKPYLEEKMWFALFWLQPLREFWRRELGDKYFLKLQEVIPYTWLLDPTPLPQHAVIPRLEIHDWREAAQAQPERARPVVQGERIFAARLGQPGYRARRRSCRTRNGSSESRMRSTHSKQAPTIMQRFHKGRCSSIAIGTRLQRVKDDARPRPPLPVLFRRSGTE